MSELPSPTTVSTASVPAVSVPAAGWSPLSAKQRRVLGVLMEKSKTTPDAYPMTFTGLTTGCNQKTNRSPITNLSTEQIEQIVDELRKLGALTIVQGNGRVDKVRHYAYQWLGLSKTEAAVMTELLLRGEQTIGELRTRASRMEPIPDLASLQTLLSELASRNLVVMLTPAGRGQIISHNIYPEWELEQLQKTIAAGGYTGEQDEEDTSIAPVPRISTPSISSQHVSNSNSRLGENNLNRSVDKSDFDNLCEAVTKLSARVDFLERELGINTPG